jgi:ribonuclease HI
MGQNMGLETIQIYGDSLLIINQLLGTYGVKKLELVPYFLKAKELISQFSDVKIEHIIRSQNNKVDALASLATSLSLNSCQTMDIRVEERRILPMLSQEEDTSSTSVLAAEPFEIE